MKYLFFINPTAGKGGLQKKIIADIESYFAEHGGDFRIHITQFKGEAMQMSREIAQTGERVTIFACGGEGTVYEVLGGIVGFDNVTLGVIPCGSANDFLKYFDSKEPFADIAAQIGGEGVKMDIIKAGDAYCLNGCSVGMDAAVADNMIHFKRWPLVSGPMAYKLAIVKTILGKIGVNLKLSIDNGEPISGDFLFAVIANAPYYGGGYNAAPKAIPNDGQLDCTLVDKISKPRILKFLPLYQHGRHEGLDCCRISRCSSMEFASERPIPVNLDGEIVRSTGMRFEIVKNGVSFLIPQGVNAKLLTNV